MTKKILWLRDEIKKFEYRSALSPESAKILIQNNIEVVVEKSINRIFDDKDYLNIGCKLVESGSWKNQATKETYILGLKELEDEDLALKHKHIYFAHAYKNQTGSDKLLNRFKAGGGELLDLEYLVDENFKRVAAFGYWAGFVGAGVGLEILLKQFLSQDLTKYKLKYYKNKSYFLDHLKNLLKQVEDKKIVTSNVIKTLVIGANGRCGTGATDLLKSLNIQPSLWGPKDTKGRGLFKEILEHHLLLNCVFIKKSIPAFLDIDFLNQQNSECKLKVISDVSCDPTGPYNPLPLYNKENTFQKPIHFLSYTNINLNLTAVDHLPSVLPKESSQDFSSQLSGPLISFLLGVDKEGVFARASKLFKDKIQPS
ncbi:MAG: saccharopine dehydrogenase [Bdellovibrionales bacterium]|nr:saccharopine dehydrogenase [Bdellovibrionales bacterium]